MSRRAYGGLLLVVVCGAGLAWGWLRVHEQKRVERRIAGLTERREELRSRLARLRGADPAFRNVPDADVIIGLPLSTLSRLLEDTLAGVLRQIEIELHHIRVHHQDAVKARTFLGEVTTGEYVVDLDIEQVKAILEPGRPATRLAGQRINLVVPVMLAKGEGRGGLRLKWSSRGVAGAICADFETKERVSGWVRPRTYEVKGGFDVLSEGGTLIARPGFSDVKLHLEVEPSRASWAMLTRLIDERPLQCRAALKLANVSDAVKEMLARGFDVRLPGRVIKPIKLPARVEQAVELDGKRYVLAATTPRVVVGDDQLWFGVCVDAVRFEQGGAGGARP
jgi:hypothetical protein